MPCLLTSSLMKGWSLVGATPLKGWEGSGTLSTSACSSSSLVRDGGEAQHYPRQSHTCKRMTPALPRAVHPPQTGQGLTQRPVWLRLVLTQHPACSCQTLGARDKTGWVVVAWHTRYVL